MSKNNIYIAEALLKERKRKGVIEYLVKWRGWSTRHNSWEPQENIIGERLFEEFEARNARKATRRGGGRRSRRVKHVAPREDSEDEDASFEPSTSRRQETSKKRGRPKKKRKIVEEEEEEEEQEEEEEEETGEVESKEEIDEKASNVESMSLEEEKKEDEEEEEEEEAPEDDDEEYEEKTVGKKRRRGRNVRKKPETKVEKKEEAEESTSQNVSEESNDPLSYKSQIANNIESSSLVTDQEPGPSTVEQKKANPKVGDLVDSVKVEETIVKADDALFKRPVDKEIPVPRTFIGHMTPMRIESSEHRDGVETHAFVLSEPGSSTATEQLQVFNEMEQIQAIKKDLMKESSWAEHGVVRHDSFQYEGALTVTEVVGKDGKPMRFLSL